ncbi:PAAR motif-containing protein [Cupriavidus sp. OV038]|jgi:uncharacterized Zn-binding protein involved in type VI secretion|uniref:M35 family metallo-endopeptidase n=1 Tax=unclassified Cupriavidus TaxID=2640874 RepID=UPI0008E45B91|nr:MULTISPECIES: M35 family metallo-endopeptidase [unclassified Cupriavidus]SFC42125.1 PAAR motif-containing protein [Cupriavidus sp. OV038]SFP31440.1 PAAR motif-containing protein [Cupriavidus sp. OV096]
MHSGVDGVDERYLLGDGDRTGTQGILTASSNSTNMGKRIAVEGDFATCPACKVGGPVYNDCDPHWTDMGKSVLVDGAIVFCQCKEKPRIFASQFTMSTEVNRRKGAATVVSPVRSQWADEVNYTADGTDSRKRVADDPKLICPNMSNQAFAQLTLRLCAALVARTETRLAELRRWDNHARGGVETWFGVADNRTRERLTNGLTRMLAVFENLRPINFVRHNANAFDFVGCVSRPNAETRGVVAAVCKPDVKTHTIAIALKFCELPEFSDRSDSQLLTIAHEVSHFHDTMDTEDDYYKLWNAIAIAREKNERCIRNADNVAGYIVVHGPIPDSFGAFIR